MFKYLVFACILAFAAAKPGYIAAQPALYAAPLSAPYAYTAGNPLAYTAGNPLAYTATYSKPLAYAAPYGYNSYAYNYRAPLASYSYSALPAAYLA